MSLFSTNPILFKIKYINKDAIDTTTSPAFVLGQAFHKAMEVYYGGSDQVIISSEAEALEYGMKAGMEFIDMYNDGFIGWNTSYANKQQLFDKFTFAFNAYTKERPYTPDLVAGVEEEFTEKIDVEWRGEKLTLPIPLKGYTDLIIEEGDLLKIEDYKTCKSFSDPDKIDARKILQAVIYYFLVYAKTGRQPHSMTFTEVKVTQNRDGSPQVKQYEIVYAENELFFDFFFRFYDDITRAINGQMVWVPNIDSFFDNEVAIIAYINRLDVEEERAQKMAEHKVSNITDLLKKEIQNAGNMRKLMKTVEEQFVSAKSLNYEKMKNHEKIATKMMEHGMMIQFDSVVHGHSVDQYRFTPSIGLKMSRIRSYVADVEQVLGVSGIRVLAPIPNTSFIGFEVPKTDRTFPELPSGGSLMDLNIGMDVMGTNFTFDLREAPHMLVAGASGAGKSVFLNAVIKQLVGSCELHLFDPKMVELAAFEDDAVEYKTEVGDIFKSLYALEKEMDDRYLKLKELKKRNIEGTGMPYKVIVIDEFGDIIAQRTDESKMVEASVLRLAQKARAAGMHLIISTQRPSVDVITGTIKANFPTKVAFRVAKTVDSHVILDQEGAEKLLGKGDMLFSSDTGIVRLQGYNA